MFGSKPNSLVKCPECGKWYEFLSHTVKNQQMCPTCIRRAETEADSHRRHGVTLLG